MRETQHRFETAEQALSKLPESVNLHFLFAMHKYKEDFSRLPDLLKSCDIYIPEIALWDDDLLQSYNRIAQGSKEDYRRMRKQLIGLPDEAAKAFELGLVYGSHKKIAMAGFRSYDPRSAEFYWIQKSLNELGQESNQELLHQHQLHGELQAQREEQILYDIANYVPPLITGSKKLAAKPDVNVLINLGPAHTPVYKAAAKALNTSGERRVTRTLFEKPLLYPLDISITRRHLFGLPANEASILEDVRRMEEYRPSASPLAGSDEQAE